MEATGKKSIVLVDIVFGYRLILRPLKKLAELQICQMGFTSSPFISSVIERCCHNKNLGNTSLSFRHIFMVTVKAKHICYFPRDLIYLSLLHRQALKTIGYTNRFFF